MRDLVSLFHYVTIMYLWNLASVLYMSGLRRK